MSRLKCKFKFQLCLTFLNWEQELQKHMAQSLDAMFLGKRLDLTWQNKFSTMFPLRLECMNWKDLTICNFAPAIIFVQTFLQNHQLGVGEGIGCTKRLSWNKRKHTFLSTFMMFPYWDSNQFLASELSFDGAWACELQLIFHRNTWCKQVSVLIRMETQEMKCCGKCLQIFCQYCECITLRILT